MKPRRSANWKASSPSAASSQYLQKRSREWLKIKIVRQQECVIGGYTDPRGARENFGSVVLGLYDDEGRLIHVGHAGSGFTEESHAALWKRLHALETKRSPFFGKVESTRPVHFVKPELVAEIKFTEWTHEGQSGGMKMRAPVFEGLRFDKKPEECKFERPASASAGECADRRVLRLVYVHEQRWRRRSGPASGPGVPPAPADLVVAIPALAT